MLLDKGGAEVRRGSDSPVSMPGIRMRTGFEKPNLEGSAAAKIRVLVSETHDGAECDCLGEVKVLQVGDELTLVHTCHDGRVDRLTMRIEKIGLPVHHGTVS